MIEEELMSGDSRLFSGETQKQSCKHSVRLGRGLGTSVLTGPLSGPGKVLSFSELPFPHLR